MPKWLVHSDRHARQKIEHLCFSRGHGRAPQRGHIFQSPNDSVVFALFVYLSLLLFLVPPLGLSLLDS